jgi:hypothetical protein
VTSKSSRCAPSIICDNSVPLTLCKTYARDLSGTSQYNLYRLSDAHNDTDSFLAIAAFEYQRLDTKGCLSRRSNKPARRRSQRPLVSFFSLNNQERYSRIAPSLLANKAWQDLLLERFMRSQVDGNSEGSIRARSGDLKTFWQNASNRFDVSGDGRVSPIDLAQLIWFLNSDKHQAGQLPPKTVPEAPFVDVNGDGRVTTADANELEAKLNARPSPTPTTATFPTFTPTAFVPPTGMTPLPTLVPDPKQPLPTAAPNTPRPRPTQEAPRPSATPTRGTGTPAPQPPTTTPLPPNVPPPNATVPSDEGDGDDTNLGGLTRRLTIRSANGYVGANPVTTTPAGIQDCYLDGARNCTGAFPVGQMISFEFPAVAYKGSQVAQFQYYRCAGRQSSHTGAMGRRTVRLPLTETTTCRAFYDSSGGNWLRFDIARFSGDPIIARGSRSEDQITCQGGSSRDCAAQFSSGSPVSISWPQVITRGGESLQFRNYFCQGQRSSVTGPRGQTQQRLFLSEDTSCTAYYGSQEGGRLLTIYGNPFQGGQVTSSPSGINCNFNRGANECQKRFPPGSPVNLSYPSSITVSDKRGQQSLQFCRYYCHNGSGTVTGPKRVTEQRLFMSGDWNCTAYYFPYQC